MPSYQREKSCIAEYQRISLFSLEGIIVINTATQFGTETNIHLYILKFLNDFKVHEHTICFSAISTNENNFCDFLFACLEDRFLAKVGQLFKC